MVDGFHDGVIGCAHFDGGHEQMMFIELMHFGPGLNYNPKPILGGVFWFDLPILKSAHTVDNWYGREISRVGIDVTGGLIEFRLQDEPYESFAFKFGTDASFQFITSP